MKGSSLFLFLFYVSQWCTHAGELPLDEERYLEQDLREMVAATVPPKQFLLQASIQYERYLQKRLLRGEKEQSESGTSLNEDQPEPRPGFVPPVGKKQGRTRTVVQEEWLSRPKLVNIFLVLDKTISETQEKEIRSLLSLRLQGFPQEQIQFHIRRTSLRNSKLGTTYANAWQLFSWALFAILILAFAGLILRWVLGTRTRAVQETRVSHKETLSPEKEEKRNVSTERSPFFAEIVANPSSFRDFYLDLKEEDRALLTSIFAGPAFMALLVNLEIEPAKNKHADSTEKQKERLNELSAQFKDFIAVKKWQRKTPKGWIRSLGKKELETIANTGAPELIKESIPLLTPQQTAALLDALPDDPPPSLLVQKASTDPKQVAEKLQMLLTLEQQHNQRDPGQAKAILMASTQPESILPLLQKAFPDEASTLGEFAQGMRNLFALSKSRQKKLLHHLENRELAAGMMDLSEKERTQILEMLSETRRSLIESEMQIFSTGGKQKKLAELKRGVRRDIWREING